MSLNLGAILALVISGVLAYISWLKSKLEQHQTENAILKSQAQENEWKREIEAAKGRVNESDKDYNQSSTDFRTKYPDDGSSTK